MVTTFSVNKNNDIFIGQDGNLSISTGINAVLQACAQAASTQRGEMIYAINQGMPNFQTIWGVSPNLPQFEAALRQTLSRVPGVIEILNLSSGIIDNVLSYTAVIVTQYGQQVLNGNL